jgi:hypothetical protein
MSRIQSDFDNAWKEMLEHYFPAFMAFFVPEAHEEIDWSRPPEFLDKELQQAVRLAGRGKRTVDKLVRIWLKNGEEAWILVHVEIQSQVEREFAQRMFICNTLMFARHKRCVVSFGILGDTQVDWRPARFQYGLWGCLASLEYPIVKLLDYEGRWEELEQSTNPFAFVVMAHLKTQATRSRPETRLQWKLRLLRELHCQGRKYEEFADLFRFLDLAMSLPPDLEEGFTGAIARYEEEQTMPLLSNFERRAIERGLQQGSVQTAREAVLEALYLRFSEAPPSLGERIQQLDDPSALKQLHRTAITAGSLEEFERELLVTSGEA